MNLGVKKKTKTVEFIEHLGTISHDVHFNLYTETQTILMHNGAHFKEIYIYNITEYQHDHK